MMNAQRTYGAAVALRTIKRPTLRYLLPLCCVFLLFLVEVYEVISALPARHWNGTNLKAIHAADPQDFTFAVFGDNRNSRVVFENLLKRIDHDPDIAFAVSLGDTVQKGNKERYRWFLHQVRANLGIPLLTAMGNHEYRAGGPDLYRALFGPTYYSFDIGDNLFLVLDDGNGKGIDPAQREWLVRELERCGNQRRPIVFLHTPLYDPWAGKQPKCLPRHSSEDLIRLFSRYGVGHIFASHIHGYYSGQWEGIPFTITGGGGAPPEGNDPDHDFFHFLKVHITKGQVHVAVEKLPHPLAGPIGRIFYGLWMIVSSWRFYWPYALLPLLALCLFIGLGRRKHPTEDPGRQSADPGREGHEISLMK
ncbi:MAG: metallophosphoesterase [Deltaproteobacteria bacterium]|nr:metallophosphoesterase [Deltaproteobacteria bacterium]